MSAHLVKASILKKVAKSIGKNFTILSSATDKNVDFKKIEFASYGCKTCKTEFATTKGQEPFCVSCGSSSVEEIKASLPKEDLASYKDDEVACVQCSNCKTYNVMSMQTAHLLDTKLNCVTCGTEIAYDLPEDEEMDDLENPEIPESDELPVEDTPLEDDDIDSDIETEEVDIDDTELPLSDEDENTELSDLNDNDYVGTDAPENNTGVDTAIDTKGVKAPEAEEQEKPNAEAGDGAKISDTGTGDGNLKTVDVEEVALFNLVEGSLSFERYGEKIIAKKGETHVATLHKSKAFQEHAAYFNARNLIPAIEHTAKISSMEKAFAEFNFEVATVKIPVPQIVESRVKVEVAKVESEVSSKLKELNDDFNQCLALASVALSKNAYKDKTNVLKTSLIENMTAAGVRGAGKIVSNIFAQHSAEYHRALLELATSLMSKSIEHRNELAEFLEISNPVEDEYDEDYENGSEEDDDEDYDIEARLERASIKTKSQKSFNKVNLGASEVSSIVSDIREKNNGSLFTKRI